MLTERLKRKYRKNDQGMYEELLDKQATAIGNAKRLLKRYLSEEDPARNDPSTTVFRLVEVLNGFQRRYE